MSELYEVKNFSEHCSCYYCVKVPKSISQSEEIYIYADNIQIGESGELNFLIYNSDQSEEEIALTIAATNWKVVYLADKKRGTPINVHRWRGEIKEVIIEEHIEMVGNSSCIDLNKAEGTIPTEEESEEE
jgi:hypothetical protein